MIKQKYINSCLCGASTRMIIANKLHCLNCNEQISSEWIIQPPAKTKKTATLSGKYIKK